MKVEAREPRILMVCSQIPPVYGGAGQQAMALSEKLVRQGCSVTVLSLNQHGAADRAIEAQVAVRRVGRHKARRSRGRFRQTASLSIHAFMMAATGPFDVVHFHGSYWWTVAGFIGARLRRRPVLIKVTRLGEDDPLTTSRKRWHGLALGRLYGLPHRRADLVIALSQEIVDVAAEAGVDAELIPNGVDVERFRPASTGDRDVARAALGLPLQGVHVLHSGYLAEHKGVMTLIDAWSLARERLPGGSTLLLAGPVSGFYRELNSSFEHDLRAAAAKAGQVRFLGKVEPESMAQLYRAADVYALLSYVEGMPNSLMEALASGLPAVVTAIPGSVDVVNEGSFARVVTPHDPVGAAAAIAELGTASTPARSEMSTEARRRAEQLSLESAAAKYLSTYGFLIRQARGNRGGDK